MSAYRCFLRAHARVTRCLEADLIAQQRLTLPAYDVLDALATADDGRRRMTELADAVLLSRSGVTRLVDRLERVGLVRRVPVDSDGRGVLAAITDLGRLRLRTARATHDNGIARYFLAAAGEDDTPALVRACERLAEGGVPALPGQSADA